MLSASGSPGVAWVTASCGFRMTLPSCPHPKAPEQETVLLRDCEEQIAANVKGTGEGGGIERPKGVKPLTQPLGRRGKEKEWINMQLGGGG